MKTTRNIALRILLVLVSRTVTAFSTARTSIVSAAHHDNIHQKDRYYGYFIPIVKPRRPKVWEGERSSRLNVAPAATASVLLSPSHTFLVRILFLRAAAFVYGIAFLVALRQNKALIGDRGITPARRILEQAEAAGTFKRRRRLQWRNNGGDATREEKSLTTTSGWRRLVPKLQRPRFGRMLGRAIDGNEKLVHLREILWDRSVVEDRPVTTLLWLARDRTNLNHWLDGIALTGLGLSGMILFMGAANVPIMLAVWLCHRSLMAVGGVWYGYGWEPQLSELGFHTLFCVPLLSLDPFCPVRIPAALIWCIRWYLFRIMIGAGLIKFRCGDKKWKELRAMNYFYETQPLPNPLTRYLHWMPPAWHKIEVLSNHFVELVAPWLFIWPGLPVSVRRTGGLIQLVFQSVLISSGNLGFLNWLTMVPAIMCFDDAFLGRFCSPVTQSAARSAAASSWLYVSIVREVISLAFLAFVLTLSRPVVENLLSKSQSMNRSYDPLRLINTYGAFGTVKEVREELIISSATNWDGPWKEYEFKAKPGDVCRSPRFISPYHYRLDWQMWIAANCMTIDRSSWMYSFFIKLLQQDDGVLNSLMAGDPWNGSCEPPKYIRIDRYYYKFHETSKNEQNPPYWDRELLGRFYPRQGLATIESLKGELGGR